MRAANAPNRSARATNKENADAASRAEKLKLWRQKKAGGGAGAPVPARKRAAPSRKPSVPSARPSTSSVRARPSVQSRRMSGPKSPAGDAKTARTKARARVERNSTRTTTATTRARSTSRQPSRARSSSSSRGTLSKRASPRSIRAATNAAKAPRPARASRKPASTARAGSARATSAAGSVRPRRRGPPKDKMLDKKENKEALLRLALIPSIEEALMYKQINQPQKAREAFQRILESPELPEARRKAVYWVARARFEEDEGELPSAVQLYEEGFKYVQSPWERDTLEKGLRNFVLRLSMNGQTPNIDALLQSPSAATAGAGSTAADKATPSGVPSLPTPELAKRLSFSAILTTMSSLVRGTATAAAAPQAANVPGASTTSDAAPVVSASSASTPATAASAAATTPVETTVASASAPAAEPVAKSCVPTKSPGIPTGTVSRLKALWESKTGAPASTVAPKTGRRTTKPKQAAAPPPPPATAPVPSAVPALPAPASPAPAAVASQPSTPRSLGPARRVATPVRAVASPDTSAASPLASPDAGLLCLGDGVEVDMFAESEDLFASGSAASPIPTTAVSATSPHAGGSSALAAAAGSTAEVDTSAVDIDAEGVDVDMEADNAWPSPVDVDEAPAPSTAATAPRVPASPARRTPAASPARRTPVALRTTPLRGSARRVSVRASGGASAAAAVAHGEARGSVVITEVVKASKRTAEEMGSDFFLSPVRRSLRVRSSKRQRARGSFTAAKQHAGASDDTTTSNGQQHSNDTLADLLKAANYSYRPNVALLHPTVDLSSRAAAAPRACVKVEPSPGAMTYPRLVAHTAGASPAPRALGPPSLHPIDLTSSSDLEDDDLDNSVSVSSPAGDDADVHKRLEFSFNSQQ